MSKLHDERMRRFVAAGIYLVTSKNMSGGRDTVEIVKAALSGGIRLVQLREKELPEDDFLTLACEVRKLTAESGALLIINDRLEIAQAVVADGVHLGQDDFPLKEARKLAPDLILGSSTHSVEEALRAQEDGASYINIGPLFPTKTKKWDSAYLGMEGLKVISAVAKVPFTVMGGIKKQHIPALRGAGVRTIAVVTEITAAENPARAASDLLALLN